MTPRGILSAHRKAHKSVWRIARQGHHLRDAYDLCAGDWVLVRPDGCVGAIAAPGETGALERYMAGVGLATGNA